MSMLHHQPVNLLGATWNEVTNEIRAAPTMPNREFLEMFARPGRVGLAGEAAIAVAGSRCASSTPSAAVANVWTHAFVFEGRRLDGQHWVIESDFQSGRQGFCLGVQESRMSKYFDERLYRSLAVLDFRISDDQMMMLHREGLELVACRSRCSLRQLFGPAALPRRLEAFNRTRKPGRKRSVFCSAFIRYLLARAGMDLGPALLANEDVLADITRIPLPHMTYLLRRSTPAGKGDTRGPGVDRVPRGRRPD